MSTQTIETVAEPATNGHATDLAERHLHTVGPDEVTAAPAKIKRLAEDGGKRQRRGPITRWRGWRASRPAKAVRERGTTVAKTSSATATDWARLYPWLIRFVVAVVAVTFALSYHGLFEWGHTIALLPFALALAVPVGLDVFSLCSLIATFLCRDAHWRVRAYCWAMFLVTVGLSVAGNAAYAYAVQVEAAHGKPIVWGLMRLGAVAGAAIWPALAAGALHLLIIARRHLATQRALVETAAAEVEHQAQVDQLQRARAIELVAAGGSCQDVADEIGSTKRTVERWTQDVRAAIATAAKTAPTKARTR